MNLIELEKVKFAIKDLQSYRQRSMLSLSEDSSLMILRHSPFIERNYPELDCPLYLVSLRHGSKTLNKKKIKNVSLFISLVGRDVYDYLEGLASKDSSRYFNKGSGIGYVCLSLDEVMSMLSLLYRHNKHLSFGGDR